MGTCSPDLQKIVRTAKNNNNNASGALVVMSSITSFYILVALTW